MHASEEEMKFIEERYYPEFIEGIELTRTACVDTTQEKDEGRHKVALGFVVLGIVKEVRRED